MISCDFCEIFSDLVAFGSFVMSSGQVVQEDMLVMCLSNLSFGNSHIKSEWPSFPQMRQVGLLNNATLQLGIEGMHSQKYEPNLAY